MALAACPPNKGGATDDPEDEGTTSSVSTSTTTAAPTSSGTGETTAPSEPDTSTGETTAPSEPGTTTGGTTAPPEPSTTTGGTTAPSDPSTTTGETTSTTSGTTTLDPDSTGGDACEVDLAVSLTLDFDQCTENLVLVITLHNVGTVELPAGIAATFYEGTDTSGLKLGTKPTVKPLPAGSSTDITWTLDAPPADDPGDFYVEADRGPSIEECDENNNSAVVTDAACPD